MYFKKWAEMSRIFWVVKEGPSEEDSMLANSFDNQNISWGTHSLWVCISEGSFLLILQVIKCKISLYVKYQN